jgi:hypothetical protein
MFSSTRSREAVEEAAPAEPAVLVRLAELAGEGFGWDGPLVATPRDAIDALARQLGNEVVFDDLGRRCVSRGSARRLFAERAAGEARQREARERLDAQYAERAAANPVWGGIPSDRIPEGVAPALAMLTAAGDARPRRQSVLEHALADRDGAIEYFPIEQVPE